jgi:hypothetical protein
MQHLIAIIIPHAVAVALSPMPIAALILLLLSNKAKLNSVAFMFGWVFGLIINIAVFAFIFNQQPINSAKTWLNIVINVALGLLLLYFAFVEWKSRPKPGIEPPMPKWMKLLESMSPILAFAIAFSLITINSKNTILDITVGAAIGQLTNTTGQAIIAILVYTFIASITIVVPVIAFLIFGDKLSKALQITKEWFVYNSATILFILFLILGVNLLCKAFGG